MSSTIRKVLNNNMAESAPRVIYLGWSRLHRQRANLIQTLHTAAAFSRLQLDFTLYLPPWKKDVRLDTVLAGLGIHDPVDVRPSRLLHRRWGGLPFVLAHFRALRRADAVYTRVPELSLLMARRGISHHFEVHDTETMLARKQLDEIVAHHRRGTIDTLVAISETARQRLEAAGAPAGRTMVAASGVDHPHYARLPLPDEARFRQPRLVYVGRVSRTRGLDVLETLALRWHHPVTIIGPVDEGSAPKVPVQPQIAHVDVADAYDRHEIAVMPYRDDLQHVASISPIKLFEAMAAGRVVIASDLPALRGLIRDGIDGLLVDARDPEAWHRAIERVRLNPGLATAMASAARQRAEEFSWSRRVERIAGRILHLAPDTTIRRPELAN